MHINRNYGYSIATDDPQQMMFSVLGLQYLADYFFIDSESSMGHLQREAKTAQAMIELYCRYHHGGTSLCSSCKQLLEFSNRRLDYCPFGEEKPTCAKCQIHCYKPQMREPMREVMRWAGPRMIWHHPWLTLLHIIDKRRDAPKKPPKKNKR